MHIAPLLESHIEEIIGLSDVVFGEGFLTENYVRQYINSSSHIGMVSIDNKKLVAYILIDVLPYREFLKEILETKEWFEDKFKRYNTINLIKQIAVTEKNQNKGIATRLINESLNRAEKVSEVTCCLAWKKGNDVSLKNTLLKNGFDYKLTIDNYWNKDSMNKNYSCAYCGLPPCNCDTEVYIKKKASVNN